MSATKHHLYQGAVLLVVVATLWPRVGNTQVVLNSKARCWHQVAPGQSVCSDFLSGQVVNARGKDPLWDEKKNMLEKGRFWAGKIPNPVFSMSDVESKQSSSLLRSNTPQRREIFSYTSKGDDTVIDEVFAATIQNIVKQQQLTTGKDRNEKTQQAVRSAEEGFSRELE